MGLENKKYVLITKKWLNSVTTEILETLQVRVKDTITIKYSEYKEVLQCNNKKTNNPNKSRQRI